MRVCLGLVLFGLRLRSLLLLSALLLLLLLRVLLLLRPFLLGLLLLGALLLRLLLRALLLLLLRLLGLPGLLLRARLVVTPLARLLLLRGLLRGLLPLLWNFRVGIHFAHRVMAGVLCFALPWFAFSLRGDRGASGAMRLGAIGLLILLATQIFLGAQIIWTYRAAAMTTGHVLVGALTLVTTFWLTWLAHRDAMEQRAAA